MISVHFWYIDFFELFTHSRGIEKHPQLIFRKRPECPAFINVFTYLDPGKSDPAESGNFLAEVREDPSYLMSLSFVQCQKSKAITGMDGFNHIEFSGCDLFAVSVVTDGKSGCNCPDLIFSPVLAFVCGKVYLWNFISCDWRRWDSSPSLVIMRSPDRDSDTG